MICIDIARPIEPRLTRGHRYKATRFPDAKPLKGITMEEVIKFYCRMGFPQRIYMDRGSQFLFMIIKHTFTGPYHVMGY